MIVNHLSFKDLGILCENLTCMQKVLNLIPGVSKLNTVTHTYSPNTLKVKTDRQDEKFKATLGKA